MGATYGTGVELAAFEEGDAGDSGGGGGNGNGKGKGKGEGGGEGEGNGNGYGKGGKEGFYGVVRMGIFHAKGGRGGGE